MNVRLTGLCSREVIIDGAMADPPEVGKPFSVLVLAQEKLFQTGQVASVQFDHFITECGVAYSWARVVGLA